MSLGQGLWHLPGGIDAVSLRLDTEAKTFAWGIFGCDFSGGGQGRLEEDGHSWTLLPAQGMSTFGWVSDGSFGSAVTTLTATVDGELDVLDIRGQVGGSAVVQVWEHGGSCAICEDGFPSGKEICDDPVLPE